MTRLPAPLRPAPLRPAPLRHDRRGVTTLEFAIVGPMLIVLMLAIIEVALLGWTQVVLQLTATQTARYLGLNRTDQGNPTLFAVNTATSWLFADAVTAAGVRLETNVTCSGAPGHYARVTITSQFQGTTPLPGILGGGQLSAKACYFTGA
jgi:Flp pilus assembly protein TadG